MKMNCIYVEVIANVRNRKFGSQQLTILSFAWKETPRRFPLPGLFRSAIFWSKRAVCRCILSELFYGNTDLVFERTILTVCCTAVFR
ncbi:hypothetical protein K0M31_019491 [Melipona bicolor]|uniref:Uncharacterized protein n=1 Tax=Melipona bicolor TaxID=60889 RepID=A0AA40KR56_9HYME|nr:hypothetical protein K0M31_019491 [Melipona bicolor]